MVDFVVDASRPRPFLAVAGCSLLFGLGALRSRKSSSTPMSGTHAGAQTQDMPVPMGVPVASAGQPPMRGRFDVNTGKENPKFDPNTGVQNW